MTCLATKLYRFSVMIGLIAAEGAEHHEAHGAAAEKDDSAALRRVGKIQPPFVGHGRGVLDRPAALRPGAEAHDREARDEKSRRDQISEDAEVGIFFTLGEIHPNQEYEREQPTRGDDGTDGADPVIEMRAGTDGS